MTPFVFIRSGDIALSDLPSIISIDALSNLYLGARLWSLMALQNTTKLGH